MCNWVGLVIKTCFDRCETKTTNKEKIEKIIKKSRCGSVVDLKLCHGWEWYIGCGSVGDVQLRPVWHSGCGSVRVLQLGRVRHSGCRSVGYVQLGRFYDKN